MAQVDLFAPAGQIARRNYSAIGLIENDAGGYQHEAIRGLTYAPEYISEAEEARLIGEIDEAQWMTDLKRRVQHYGYRYDYKTRRIDESMRVADLPDWAKEMGEKLRRSGYFAEAPPDQMIVNEYKPGQGIAPHIDCEPCFGDTIISLSLGSEAVMEFSRGGKKHPVLLERRSIVALTGEARDKWKHAIPARKSDETQQGEKILRSRRISMTFRKVILADSNGGQTCHFPAGEGRV